PDLCVALRGRVAVTCVGLACILENAVASVGIAVAQLEPCLGMPLIRCPGKPLDGLAVTSLDSVSVVVEICQLILCFGVPLVGGLFQAGTRFTLVGPLVPWHLSLRKHRGRKQARCEAQHHKTLGEIHESYFPRLWKGLGVFSDEHSPRITA